MGWASWAFIAATGWVGFALLAWWINRASPRREDPLAGLVWRAIRLYARLLHRRRIEGREHIPGSASAGPLIVVANHTAGVDPLLIQSACPFEIRWIMAEDMRWPALDGLWRWGRVIFIDRRARRAGGLREAVRHLRAGGVIGVFPEGRIERPARTILPFAAGVGMLILRGRSAVLPVVIDGTPRTELPRSSLYRPSRARLRFMSLIQPEDLLGRDPQRIADDLRRRWLEWTGWPSNDAPVG